MAQFLKRKDLHMMLLAFLVVVILMFVAAAAHGQTNVSLVTNVPPTITNPSVQGEASNYFDKLVQWNDKLLGLPALPLLVIACIAFGYVVKGMVFIGNQWIRPLCYLFGILGYIVMSLITMNFKAPFWMVFAVLFKNGAIGMIGAVAADRLYVYVVKPAERKWAAKFGGGDTDIIARGTAESGSKITVTEKPAPEP